MNKKRPCSIKNNLSTFVSGSVNGLITTSAIIATLGGANISPLFILIITLVTLFSNGLANAVSLYLSGGNTTDNGCPLLLQSVLQLLSFVIIGAIPLIALIFTLIFGVHINNVYNISYMLIAFSLFFIGMIEGKLTNEQPLLYGVKSLIIGGTASFFSYLVGYSFKDINKEFSF